MLYTCDEFLVPADNFSYSLGVLTSNRRGGGATNNFGRFDVAPRVPGPVDDQLFGRLDVVLLADSTWCHRRAPLPGAIAGCHCRVPLLGAMARCHRWGAIAG